MGSRVSLDVDFSTDVELDEDDTARRIHRALDDRFESLSLSVFDFRFARRPAVVQDPRFSGFQATFKLLPTVRLAIVKRDLVQAQREALVIGESQ